MAKQFSLDVRRLSLPAASRDVCADLCCRGLRAWPWMAVLQLSARKLLRPGLIHLRPDMSSWADRLPGHDRTPPPRAGAGAASQLRSGYFCQTLRSGPSAPDSCCIPPCLTSRSFVACQPTSPRYHLASLHLHSSDRIPPPLTVHYPDSILPPSTILTTCLRVCPTTHTPFGDFAPVLVVNTHKQKSGSSFPLGSRSRNSASSRNPPASTGRELVRPTGGL